MSDTSYTLPRRNGRRGSGSGRNTDLNEAVVRDHTLSGELKHPKNPQASQYTCMVWSGLFLHSVTSVDDLFLN